MSRGKSWLARERFWTFVKHTTPVFGMKLSDKEFY